MLHILIPIFVGIGIATMFLHIVEILIFLFSKIKKRIKIKFLCKHTYKIDSICGDGEVEVTCCKCGKKKFIRFSSKSLTEFRIGGKKCD